MMMDMSGSNSTVSSVYSTCTLGYLNGTYPDGSKGGGIFKFGHYVATAAERTACQVGNEPWAASVRYVYWSMYIICAYFAVCAAVNHLANWTKFNRSIGLAPVVAWPSRLTAAFRWLDSRRPATWIPPTGTLLVSLGLMVFGNAVCFGIRPYYRPPNFGSSPLGLRSEWVSTALIVWVVALGVKRNALGFLTGIPYQRLLDYHKTFGWACCFFAVVHTVAMMIRVNAQGAPWSYTWSTSPISYGWAAWGSLLALFWLCVLSLGPVRRLCHELFYILHMVGVLLFIVFMYYHCFNALVSWPLMHATVVVLGTAMLYRFLVTAVQTAGFLKPQQAIVKVIEDGALRIRVTVDSSKIKWEGGQHFFVRFTSPSFYPWQTHPFTVANLVSVSGRSSLPTIHQGSDLEKQESRESTPSQPSPDANFVHFVLRPYSGLTCRLFNRASSASGSLNLSVLLDGPYSSGAAEHVAVSSSDRTLVVAGGTGLSFALPLVLEAMSGSSTTAPSARLQAVDVAWAVRHVLCVEWYRSLIDQTRAVASARGIDFRLTLYVSRFNELDLQLSLSREDEIRSEGEKDVLEGVEVVQGRPDGAALVRAATKIAAERLVVVSCGPPTLALGVRNATAAQQLDIIRGTSAVRDLELVEEVYE